MPQAPDLFVVCRTCGSEVSGYVTECPYCGARLRKRAPKLDGAAPGAGRRPSRLPKLRAGEIPGIRAEAHHRPVVTIALVVAIALGTIAMAVFPASDVGVVGSVDGQWWRVATAPFFADNVWYAVTCGVAVALFGGLLEERHGHLTVLLLFCLCGMGGIAAAAALGANGAALGLLAAWAVRPVRDARRGGTEADLLGAGIIGGVLLLMPVAVAEASPTAGAAGLILGLLAGMVLARR